MLSSTSLRPVWAFILICTPAAVTSCGGGDGGVGGNGNPNATGTARSGVRVIPSDGSVLLTRPSADRILLSGTVPTINPGDVVASALGSGVLVQATAVTRNRDGVELRVQDAAVEDAFSDVNIAETAPIGSANTVVEPGELAGVEVDMPSRGRADGEFTIRLPNLQVRATGLTIQINGEIKVSFDNNFELRLKDRYCRYTPRFRTTGMVRVIGGISGKVPIHLKTFKVTRVYIIGGVPVVVTFKVPLFLEFEAIAGPTVDLNFTPNVELQCGFIYNKGAGERVWSLAHTLGGQVSLSALYTGTVSVGLRPKPEVELYGVIGPYVDMQTPRIDAEFQSRQSQSGVDWQLYAGLFFGAGFKGQVLNKNLFEWKSGMEAQARFKLREGFISIGGGGTPSEIVIDNQPLKATEGEVGYHHWPNDQWWDAAGYGGHAYYTLTNGSSSRNIGQWRPFLPESRNWEIFVWIPHGERDRSTTARYDIYWGWTYQRSVYVNQGAYGDQWVSLGTYHLLGGPGSDGHLGENAWVRLEDATSEPYASHRLLHDAVKFVPR